jgi:microcystin synthetase protein McyJ
VFHHVAKAIEIALQTPKLLFSSDSADYYQFLGDDVVEGQHTAYQDGTKPLWLNLGYWETARRYPDAAAAMARLLGDTARLGPGDHLLDVGFGFAEQDFFWLENYGLKKITGLNITPVHVERAQARVKERGLEDRMDLRLGSATEIPFEPGTFDKITALECAFHFNTREKFFDEAMRVLRPGGRIALADGAQWPGTSAKLGFINRFVLKRWSVPVENIYDRDEYVRRLEGHGFVNVTAHSIREHVFPGCTKYKELREKGVSLQDAVVELTPEDITGVYGLKTWAMTSFTDYVIFAADKPG